ncbi:extracellular solute-binding protein [Brevibacillus humidisoli]|uniref:extracellular solute-binding protein n=1 Tax=Brevibacillus humidisoli TaxID=2895522 RepID=UPI001E4945F7|nr:extracellular solute-binding protein [Brevibacillus humidisoli]UFJ39398.1 extracellular solute-binding protein [Brevibacillus humidisoli]
MKRVFGILTAAVLFSILLAACGGSGGSEATETAGQQQDGPVTVTFWTTVRESEAVALKEIIDEFERQNKEIKVNMQLVPFGEAQNKFRAAAQAGNGPDVLRSEVAWTPEFAKLGLLEPLDDYFQDQDDFLDAPLNYSKWNGRVWSVPEVTDALALLYNKKMLAGAGFASAPKTMEEFAQAAKALSNGTDKWGFYLRQTEAYFSLPFVWAFGGGLIDEQKQILINTPGAVEGVEFALKLRDVDRVSPRDLDAANSYQNMNEAFKNGSAAMIFNGPWAMTDILSGEQFQDPTNLGIAPIPAGPGGQTGSPVGGHSLAIYAGSPVKDAAYKLIAFLTSAESQAFLASKNGTLPTRRSAYDMPELKENRMISDFQAVMEAAKNRPVIPEGGQIFAAFDPEIQAIYKGEKKPREGLDAVAQAWRTLLGQ